MPRKCIVCKVECSALFNRSFHVFPKNESIRQKWIESLNLSKIPNFKIAVVCSDHFSKESFFYIDDYNDTLRNKKRLCKDAVPNIQKISATQESTIHVNNYVNETIKDENFQIDLVEETKIHTDQIIFTNTLDSQDNSQNISVQLHSNKSEICTDHSSDKVQASVNRSDSNNQSSSQKRKHSFIDVKQIKRLRFINNFKAEYMSQEDFKSEDAWDKFLRYAAYQKSRISAAHARNWRMQNTLNNLQSLISTLEEKQESHAAE